MPEGWSEFLLASAGGAAALAGLIIVAMTANIKTILAIPTMPSRAAATIAALVLTVVCTSAALIPGQAIELLGVEVLLFAAGASVLAADSARKMLAAAAAPDRGVAWIKCMVAMVQTVPFVIGGILLVAGRDAGLYWIAAGVLIVFIGAVANAWMLLVEILR